MKIALIIYTIIQLTTGYIMLKKNLYLKHFIICLIVLLFSPILFILITDYLGLNTTNTISNLNLEIQRSTK